MPPRLLRRPFSLPLFLVPVPTSLNPSEGRMRVEGLLPHRQCRKKGDWERERERERARASQKSMARRQWPRLPLCLSVVSRRVGMDWIIVLAYIGLSNTAPSVCLSVSPFLGGNRVNRSALHVRYGSMDVTLQQNEHSASHSNPHSPRVLMCRAQGSYQVLLWESHNHAQILTTHICCEINPFYIERISVSEIATKSWCSEI